ncbi:MAG: hypothetical protein MUP21_08695 [Dehalococcoidia bacterium]|nr:hypothetical protein [Dehalococcoidia bacterium]
MEWWLVLALVLGIPLVLLPVALVWYLNISGIYQVIRATRARQKKRDKALKEAARAVQSS